MKIFRVVCVWVLCAHLPLSTHAQTPLAAEQTISAEQLSARFPKGGINSVESADRAIAEAGRARAANDAQFRSEEHACYATFFANSCLEKAKERHRQANALIRSVEIEAGSFKRKARVDARDKSLAEKEARRQADEPRRILLQQQNEQQAATQERQAVTEAGETAGKEARAKADHAERMRRHEDKLKNLEARDAQREKQRAKKAAELEKKRRDSLTRQDEILKKKSEKQRANEASAAGEAAK